MNSDERLAYLLGRHFDEALTVEEAAELNQRLLESEAARELFWREARINARLRQWGEQQVGQLLEEDAVGTTGTPVRPKRAGDGQECPSYGRAAWRWTRMVGAVAVVLLMGLVGFWAWSTIGDHQPADNIPAAVRTVARFGALENTRWVAADAHYQTGESIPAGHRLELSAGQVRIEFLSGAAVLLRGPAVFEVRSENAGFLAFGQLAATASAPQAKGFTIQTSAVRAVDLGTEFTVHAATDGHSRVAVTSGEVEVHLAASGRSHLLRADDVLEVEPGARQITTRIEIGDGTAAFRFPTIPPPSSLDEADRSHNHATIRCLRGKLGKVSGPLSVLLDGVGQSRPDAPGEAVYFEDNETGLLLLDLGRAVSITQINTYSWHTHFGVPSDRVRAAQKFNLYGFGGDKLPSVDGPLEELGWVLIARVDTDEFFHVSLPPNRPAQQASSIRADAGDIGSYHYLLWEVLPTPVGGNLKVNALFGEFDVYTRP